MAALYVTSPGSGQGKTAIALGLAQEWRQKGKKVVYIRVAPSPTAEGDAAFARRLGLEAVLSSPGEVAGAFRHLQGQPDMVVVEGPPDLQEAWTSLKAKVLLVAPFREGEEALAKAATTLGSALLGVIINTVPRSRVDQARKALTAVWQQRGSSLLGILPEERALMAPTVGELAEHFQAQVVSQDGMGELVEAFMVGAMMVDPAPTYFGRREDKAVVTRRDRPDILLGALETPTRCLLLTGGPGPIDRYVLETAKLKGVPILVVKDETAATMVKLEELMAGVRFRQEKKLPVLSRLLRENLDWPTLERGLGF